MNSNLFIAQFISSFDDSSPKEIQGESTCYKCLISKPLSSFYECRRKNPKLCIECEKERAKARYLLNIERIREVAKEWRSKNREHKSRYNYSYYNNVTKVKNDKL